MTPRALQALALMQNALNSMTNANNLLLQELAEALEPEEQPAPKPKKGKTDG